MTRCLPTLYFTVAYASLSLAFAVVGVAPRAAGGFFYHARLLGIVHLITIGWITCVILGCLYAAVPSRLGFERPIRWTDCCAFVSLLIGLIGMVAHFWIEEYGGMAWSGLMVLCGIAFVVRRVWSGVWRSTHPARLPLLLGMANILAAGSVGVLLGFDKVHHFLPGYVISNVLAHAHLAALGWASMMTLGLASSLEPRANEAATRWMILAFEGSSLALFGSLLTGSRATGLCAVAAAMTLVLAAIPFSPRNGGAASWHMTAALASLVLAAATGIVLAVLGASDLTMRLALVYGAAGLVGFLAQALLAVLLRLEPGIGASPLTFSLYSLGLTALVTAMFVGSDRALAWGAWLTLLGLLLPIVPPVAARLAALSWPHAGRHRRGSADQFSFSQGRS